MLSGAIYTLLVPSKRLMVYKLLMLALIVSATIGCRWLTHDSGLEQQPGYMGQPVNLDKGQLSPEQMSAVEIGWSRNAFNQYVSDMISVHRVLPDVRDPRCRSKRYPQVNELPHSSIVVCFHNEAWSTLIRSLHSILDRSPRPLLEEIILVDDYSTMDHLREPLDEYVTQLNRRDSVRDGSGGAANDSDSGKTLINIVRTNERQGLIRARLLGAQQARGEVLVFLDSHIECANGWLEPLVARIKESPISVVCPVIDVINDDTFEYLFRSSGNQVNVGGFDWNLQFTWHTMPEHERARRQSPIDPIRSPTMAGGLFAIARSFFQRLGRYDPGFEIWGAENLELSFKTWMCGGQLEILPCSHVGHIFRLRSPYQWKTGVNVLKKNSVRLAEVWMDDYKKFYYDRIGHSLGDYGDITERKLLRQRLKCKSFDYYVKEVYPELFVPSQALAKGSLRISVEWWLPAMPAKEMCLDGWRQREETQGSVIALNCHNLGGHQYWLLSKNNEIRRDDSCLDYDSSQLSVYRCHGSKGNQNWLYSHQLKQVKHVASSQCLTLISSQERRYELSMEECKITDTRQWWRFDNYTSSAGTNKTNADILSA